MAMSHGFFISMCRCAIWANGEEHTPKDTFDTLDMSLRLLPH